MKKKLTIVRLSIINSKTKIGSVIFLMSRQYLHLITLQFSCCSTSLLWTEWVYIVYEIFYVTLLYV